MPNNIYSQLMGGSNAGLLQQLQKFRQSIPGDPQQMIQQMLNSGRISQAQYNAAVQKAGELARILGIK